jgi:hypothetical protein
MVTWPFASCLVLTFLKTEQYKTEQVLYGEVMLCYSYDTGQCDKYGRSTVG